MGQIIFDNTNCSDFGIVVDGAAAFNAPERDVEKISVAGRNGDLIVDNGRYKNIPVEYSAMITKDFKNNAEQARAFFVSRSSAYYRLEDTYDSDHYRLGQYSDGIDFTPGFLNFNGRFTLSFDCKPQRFLISGEAAQIVTNGSTLTNPTVFDALPLIAVKNVSANTELTVNGKTIIFTTAVTVATIDCDLQECFNGASNLNSAIDCPEFPFLKLGTNNISWTGSIGELKITPRWWTL